MVSIFEFENYREFLKKRLKDMPRRGYGQMSQLARHLNVHTTLVSQILKEHKALTNDQAVDATEFFGLNELESEYFILLVHLDRAGNSAAKSFYRKQLRRVKEQSQSLSKRIKSETKLSEEQRGIFYSDWAYSAVRQSIAITGVSDVDSIAKFLSLPRKKVQQIVEFLLLTGLCKSSGAKILVGPSSTHIDANSPWARVHHVNWRQKAVQSLEVEASDDLHYTSPLTISAKDAGRVKEKIIQFIEQINEIVDPSPSENLFCFNIDWFRAT